jgi:hypothetical protein
MKRIPAFLISRIISSAFNSASAMIPPNRISSKVQ